MWKSKTLWLSGKTWKTGKPKGPNKVNVFDSTSKKKGLSAKLFGNDFAYDAIKQSLCMPIM